MSGVLSDGGGVIFVGGIPIRIPPWNPDDIVGLEERDIAIGLAVLRLASLISQPEARQELARVATRLVSLRGQELGQALNTARG